MKPTEEEVICYETTLTKTLRVVQPGCGRSQSLQRPVWAGVEGEEPPRAAVAVHEQRVGCPVTGGQSAAGAFICVKDPDR